MDETDAPAALDTRTFEAGGPKTIPSRGSGVVEREACPNGIAVRLISEALRSEEPSS